MDKKKIAVLALLGTILLGITGFGAYSWFTSSANVESNLIVETGTLKIQADLGQNRWTVENKSNSNVDLKTEVNNPNAKNDFKNARPGDSFVKTVGLENIGTLKERVNFKINKNIINDKYNGIFKIEATDDEGNELKNGTVLAKGEVKYVKLKVILDGDNIKGENGEPMQNTSFNLSEIFADSIVTATGEQVNENPQLK